jgi:hypothetical protein
MYSFAEHLMNEDREIMKSYNWFIQ